MSDYKDGDRAAIPVVITDVWGAGGLPHREGPQIEWEFAGGVEAGDPYVTSGVADAAVVMPCPDAERMALLEAVLLAAQDELTYGVPTGSHTREIMANAIAALDATSQ